MLKTKYLNRRWVVLCSWKIKGQQQVPKSLSEQQAYSSLLLILRCIKTNNNKAMFKILRNTCGVITAVGAPGTSSQLLHSSTDIKAVLSCQP